MLHTMRERNQLSEGKLPTQVLSKLLKSTSHAPGVIIGAEAGEDAAVVKGEETLIITADPITFTEENIGTYTVAVNCNDIVAMGGKPLYLTTTILLPPGTTKKRLETIFKEIKNASRKAGLYWVGGHTEVSSAVNRIIVSAQAVGFLNKEPTTTAGANPEDLLVMTKWVGLEGTTLIARDRPEESLKVLGKEAFREVLAWIEQPGISILQEGEILKNFPLSAAHDPTEGGVATGIHEIASRSKVGVRIFWDKLPLREETALLCEYFGLDPLGILSSGVFLFTIKADQAQASCRTLAASGIPASIIGEITRHRAKVLLEKNGRQSALPFFAQDEVIKLN
ncbi:Thiamine-monophosphate kinase [subsurface metagenome]